VKWVIFGTLICVSQGQKKSLAELVEATYAYYGLLPVGQAIRVIKITRFYGWFNTFERNKSYSSVNFVRTLPRWIGRPLYEFTP
jgi:hypothetical protein